MLIGRGELERLIPHQGGMCLLDGVESWDAASLRCSSRTHRDPGNPLRRDGRLSALHLAEYGAQATAVHGGLLARARGEVAPPGFLASVRDLRLAVDRIDDLDAVLGVDASLLTSGEGGWMYAFSVNAGGRELASGRVSVILMGGPGMAGPA
jgi:predicted hotdog family 3-hydroxylacyl-ACP dehydratase